MHPDDHVSTPSAQGNRWIDGGKNKVLLAVGVVVLLGLLFLAPALVALVGLVALVYGIVVWVRGRKRGLPVKRGITAVVAGAAVMLTGSGINSALYPTASQPSTLVASGPTQTAATQAVTTSSVAETLETQQAEVLTDRLGETCTDDKLVVSQGSESVYCDKDGRTLVWVSAERHRALEAEVKQAAEKKRAEEAAAKKAADEKAAAQRKKAEEKAAAKREAEEEAAAAQAAEEKAERESAAKDTTPRGFVGGSSGSGSSGSTATYYANCSAVRAAGAAPLRVGDPGYSRKLDRDGDGIACE